MKKIDIPQNIKESIITDYNNNISIRKLVDEYKYSFTVIQKLINSNKQEIKPEDNYPKKEGYCITVKCKKTGKEFTDFKNESGVLTTHVFGLYPEVSHLSKYKRKNIEHRTGKFWYDNYFDIIYKKQIEEKKCHYCDWTTTDVNNAAGSYGNHLLNVHNITITDHIAKHPEDTDYFKTWLSKQPPKDGIKCEICGKMFSQLNHTHLRTHGISVFDYKLKYGNVITSKRTKKKLNVLWNKSLKHNGFKKTSKYEKEIIDAIPEVKFIQGDRKILNGLEIDLVCEEKKICVEIDGVFYHSEIGGKKDKKYHLNKTIKAEEAGYKLIHIFEDEFIYKKDIVINKLKNILGVPASKKIHGRKCVIKDCSLSEKSVFLNENHIQGDNNTTHCIGAYFKDELVAIMSFDNKRPMNKEKNHNTDTYDISRFVVKNMYHINGIGSKILTHFIKKYNPDKIITFADRRWSNLDNIYNKLGFVLVKTLPPDYFYVNSRVSRYRRFHKFGFGKGMIKKFNPQIFHPDKTEWEMMQVMGYDRIWDCGKYKYVMILNKDN
jgi:very-short-patch-repair endonuclease